MKRYEDFIEGLQQDVKMPDSVWLQFTNTLKSMEQSADTGKDGFRMKKNRKTIGKTCVKAAAIAGILTAGMAVFSYADPAAASKLPIIGRVFEQAANDTVYSGDYKNKTVLTTDGQASESKTETVKAEKGIYKASSHGITITASEVYCDGYSIYLAAEIKSKDGGFSDIPSHYTRRFEDKTSKSLDTQGVWKADSNGKAIILCDNTFEGKAVDDNTFIGIMKLDKDQYSDRDGELHLELSEIFYDDETLENTENIEPAHRIQGTWQLTVPYSVDKEQCREIPVNKKDAAGYKISKVFMSPYQVIVFSDTPYTTLTPDTYTKEDFEAQWGQKNEEILASGGDAVTYEDMLSKKFYNYYELAVYNQNGESLEMQYGDENKTVFAVQDHELTKLHIYAGNESHEMELIKASNEQEAKEKSILDVEVDLQN